MEEDWERQLCSVGIEKRWEASITTKQGFWTRTTTKLMLFAGVFGLVGGIVGLFVGILLKHEPWPVSIVWEAVTLFSLPVTIDGLIRLVMDDFYLPRNRGELKARRTHLAILKLEKEITRPIEDLVQEILLREPLLATDDEPTFDI